MGTEKAAGGWVTITPAPSDLFDVRAGRAGREDRQGEKEGGELGR